MNILLVDDSEDSRDITEAALFTAGYREIDSAGSAKEAFGLLKLALTAPRFDSEAVERVRRQILASLRRDTVSPNDLANKA